MLSGPLGKIDARTGLTLTGVVLDIISSIIEQESAVTRRDLWALDSVVSQPNPTPPHGELCTNFNDMWFDSALLLC